MKTITKKQVNQTMKKIIFITILAITFASCHPTKTWNSNAHHFNCNK